MKNHKSFLSFSLLLIAVVFLLGACQNVLVDTAAAPMGTVSIFVPSTLPSMRSNSDKTATPKAYLAVSVIDLELRDSGGNLIDSLTLVSDTPTSWNIPSGIDLMIFTYVYNYDSVANTQTSVEGSFGPFDLAPYQTVPALITNFPSNPVALTYDVRDIHGKHQWRAVVFIDYGSR